MTTQHITRNRRRYSRAFRSHPRYERAVGMVVPVMAILLWQWVAANGWVDPLVLPAPLDVWRKWVACLLPLAPFAWRSTSP